MLESDTGSRSDVDELARNRRFRRRRCCAIFCRILLRLLRLQPPPTTECIDNCEDPRSEVGEASTGKVHAGWPASVNVNCCPPGRPTKSLAWEVEADGLRELKRRGAELLWIIYKTRTSAGVLPEPL